jgi:hypothetical protein
VIKPVDLGVCQGYEYEGDSDRTAVALPGSMLAGMPALWYVFEPLLGDGWRIVLVWISSSNAPRIRRNGRGRARRRPRRTQATFAS